MAIKLTPQESVQKWQQRTSAAVNEYVQGVNRVNESPSAKAVAQADVYLQNVQAAVNKWKRNLGAVTLEEWRDKTINVGAARIASGVNAAMEKTLRSTEANFRNIENALTGLPDRGDFQTNLRRMNEFVTRLHDEANR